MFPSRIQRILLPTTTLQVRRQSVIIGGGDCIKFVIMASGTGNRQSEERLTKNVDLVVHDVSFIAENISGSVRCLVQIPKPCPNNRLVPASLWVLPWLI